MEQEIVKRLKKVKKIIKESDNLISYSKFISFHVKIYVINAFDAPGIHSLCENFLEKVRKIHVFHQEILKEFKNISRILSKIENIDYQKIEIVTKKGILASQEYLKNQRTLSLENDKIFEKIIICAMEYFETQEKPIKMEKEIFYIPFNKKK